jgi:mono/diheme cytochrome c family protein
MHKAIKEDEMNRMQYVQGVIHLALLATMVAAPAKAEESEHKTYLHYCSACHGQDGKGDGVVSGFMNPKPSDLTQLAKKAGGKFPFYEVVQIIDGRQTLHAHGDRDMPVWGPILRSEEGASDYADAAARGKVVMITEYLASIQTK